MKTTTLHATGNSRTSFPWWMRADLSAPLLLGRPARIRAIRFFRSLAVRVGTAAGRQVAGAKTEQAPAASLGRAEMQHEGSSPVFKTRTDNFDAAARYLREFRRFILACLAAEAPTAMSEREIMDFADGVTADFRQAREADGIESDGILLRLIHEGLCLELARFNLMLGGAIPPAI